MSSFDFAGLTPDLTLDAIESVGLLPDSGLLALNSYENRVYQFSDRDGQKWVVKFYRPNRWSDDQIQEEHDFAIALETNELPIVAPAIIQNRSLHHFEGYRFSLFPCRGGRIFEVDNLDQLEWMGRFIGRIHAQSAQTHFAHRPTINCDDYLHRAHAYVENGDFIPDSLKTPYLSILTPVVESVVAHYQPSQLIRLHGDCHAGNILWTDDGPHFVDLDDCRMGPAIQDLWMMLAGDRQTQVLQMDTLLSGYEEFFDFDRSELALIEPLRAMRMIHYNGWLALRWQDPAFPRNFPWFASDRYWETQILSLKEQLAQLQAPPIQLF